MKNKGIVGRMCFDGLWAPVRIDDLFLLLQIYSVRVSRFVVLGQLLSQQLLSALLFQPVFQHVFPHIFQVIRGVQIELSRTDFYPDQVLLIGLNDFPSPVFTRKTCQ